MPVLATIRMSLSASCQVLAVKRDQTCTRSGYPVSLMFLSIVVMTMIASPTQKSTKKPLKSL